MWFCGCLRGRSDPVTTPLKGETGADTSAASDATPIASLPNDVSAPIPLVMKAAVTTGAGSAVQAEPTAASTTSLRAAAAPCAPPKSCDLAPFGDGGIRPSSPVIMPSSGVLSSNLDGRSAAKPTDIIKEWFSEKTQDDRGSLPPPPAPWAPLARGTAAGVPAAELPSWWAGKEAVPMELLEEADEAGPLPNADAESSLPPLPLNKKPDRTAAPSLKSQSNSADEPKALTFQPVAAPELRPGSYRNAGNPSRSLVMEYGCSPPPKGEKSNRASAVSSMSSRPTTADAESASTYSTSKTSWREEWTPGSGPSSEKPGITLRLPPLGSNKPPPLPPLPSKVPEGGFVLGAIAPSGGTAANLHPAAGRLAGSREPSPPISGCRIADDAALKRISLSANARVATPPPLARRRSGERPSSGSASTGGDCQEGGVSVANTKDVAAAVHAKGDTAAADGLQENSHGKFSDLALGFTSMEVT